MFQPRQISAATWMSILLLAVVWGGSFLANAVALQAIAVLTVVAVRVTGAALVLIPYVLIRRLPLPARPAHWAALAVMGLLNNVTPFLLIVWGQQHIASGLASILNASTAIIGVLVAALLLPDERLTLPRLVGVSIGFAGVVTAIGVENLARFDPGSLAQLAILGAALSYALAGVWARRFLSDLVPQVASAGMTGFAALVMLPLALWHDGLPAGLPPLGPLAALAYLAIAATAFAYLLYYRVLAAAGSGNLMVVTLLVSPVAIVLGAVLLGESLPHQAYLGFALLALGLVVMDGRFLARHWAGRRLSG